MRLSLFAILVSTGGCAVVGHTSSPWEWGGNLRVAPGLWSVNQGDATVHPVASYTYFDVDGGSFQVFEFGAQLRLPMGSPGSQAFWLGGEGTFSHARFGVDLGGGGSISSSNNGYSLTGLAGVPIGTSRWNPNIYVGAGLADYGNSGWNVRIGLDLQPTFLWGN